MNLHAYLNAWAGGRPIEAAVPMTLRLEGPNHYQGTVTFPRNGEWRLELIVQITEGQQQSLVTTVPIP